jgi:YidC/Oxa1 family membrane protein insertase
MPDQRNIILAVALSIGVLLTWFLFFPPPKRAHAPAPTAPITSPASSAAGATTVSGTPAVTIERALTETPRVPIDAPRVQGSISLMGARIDELRLKQYHATSSPKSPLIELLAPRGTKDAYYAEYGWQGAPAPGTDVPGPDTLWSLENGAKLAPGAPITLRWTSPAGVIYRLTYAIDDDFMFTITQEVANQSTASLTLTPFGRLARQTIPTGPTFMVQHEGFVGYVGDDLHERKWKDIFKSGVQSWPSTGGWLGMTDKYWLTALAPPQDQPFTGLNSSEQLGAGPGIIASYALSAQTIASGASWRSQSHLFAGARVVTIIDGYNKSLGIKKFDLAIDWGTFLWVITKPMFFLLHFFDSLVHNFGIAILLVTVLVKLIFFPLANRSFETMGKMKKLQPQMKELQERFKEDRVELQKQMMAIYQKEKINPLAGCLPLLIQIPVFFSLYKVIFSTIEMRHAPFFGWIHDLSARDPTSIINFFGLLPYHVPAFFMAGPLAFVSIGVWPIVMGLMMFTQTALNPAPPDPTQKIIFAWMPVMFTVMMASLPAGLVIYYSWNNFLSMTQQYIIMKRMGTPIDLAKALGIKRAKRVIALLMGRKPPPDSGAG